MNNSNKNIQKRKEEIQKKLKKRIEELDIKDKNKLKAVAIKYDVEKGRAPKIVASGKGLIAQEILKLAEDHSVPLYEDVTMANLLSKLDLDTEVPPALFSMVSEVLAFVYHLDKMSQKRLKLKKRFGRKGRS